MKTKISVILWVLLISYSCDSEDATIVQESSNFYALTLGNSWEYTYYLKDVTTNNFMATPVNETVDITHTIEINNNIFYNFRHIIDGNDGSYPLLPNNGEKNFMLRDSLGFLIDPTGAIKYSSKNYDEHIVDFIDDISNLTYNLELSEEEDVLMTNAGVFSCLDNHYFFRNMNGDLSNSVDHIYREANKGEILSTISFMSQNDHFAEKRLESYTVQ